MEKQISYEDYLQLEKEFKDKEKSMQERMWIDSNVGMFDDVLRANYNKSVEEFSTVVIEYLAQLTNAYQGVFYIIEAEEEVIEAVAGYACNVDNLVQKTFKFGQGLVGQAVLSRDKIFFDDLPPAVESNEAIEIKFNPKAAIIIPLLFNKSVYGVLKLIYLKSLDEKFQVLLDRVSQNIGAMLESILNNGRLQNLLDKSQEQTEAMRAQEEEMRQNLEEMAATREAQERAQREVEKLKTSLEREIAEKTAKLEESLEKFNMATQTTNEGLWYATLPDNLKLEDDTPIWFSDNFHKLLGYDKDNFPSVLGTWSALLHPDDKELVFTALFAHLMDFSGQTPYRIEYRILRKTGEYRWFRGVGISSRNEEGKPIRLAGSIIDIQDQKDLEKRTENLEMLSEISVEGIWVTTLKKGDKLTADLEFYWSPSFYRMLGFSSSEEFPSQFDSWSSRIHREDTERVLASLQKFFSNSSVKKFSEEYRIKLKNGRYRWFKSKATKKKKGNDLTKIVGSIVDIHAEKGK